MHTRTKHEKSQAFPWRYRKWLATLVSFDVIYVMLSHCVSSHPSGIEFACKKWFWLIMLVYFSKRSSFRDWALFWRIIQKNTSGPNTSIRERANQFSFNPLRKVLLGVIALSSSWSMLPSSRDSFRRYNFGMTRVNIIISCFRQLNLSRGVILFAFFPLFWWLKMISWVHLYEM